jgi:hypothetical protein
MKCLNSVFCDKAEEVGYVQNTRRDQHGKEKAQDSDKGRQGLEKGFLFTNGSQVLAT